MWIYDKLIMRDLRKLPDEKLFDLVKKGNELAFDTLFNRYWEELYPTIFFVLLGFLVFHMQRLISL